MSHEEAANLILASAMQESDGIFVQNMGQEILVTEIVDKLAKNLGIDYSTKLIGLQPGEKLHEELYAGAFSKTNFSEIVRVEIDTNYNFVERIKELGLPSDNLEALGFIDQLLIVTQ